MRPSRPYNHTLNHTLYPIQLCKSFLLSMLSVTHHPPILTPVIVYSEPKSKATQLYAPAAGILQYVQGSSVKI